MGLLSKRETIEYDLPEDRIALYPASPRDGCRLMVVRLPDLRIQHRVFRDIDGFFGKGDAIAVNDSRVINARIKGRKSTGGAVEFLLLKRGSGGWLAMGRPASRLREGMIVDISAPDGSRSSLKVVSRLPGGRFIVQGSDDELTSYGYVPLPPYIAARRQNRESDSVDYQTLFAGNAGSVASPTSALHFTHGLIKKIREGGAQFAPVTLHIGPGTFQNSGRPPEEERYTVPGKTSELLNGSKRICVCGTTVMRTLETVYDGKKYLPGTGETDLFITPGYEFSPGISMFLTNFHLPGTSLLLMVASFIERYLPSEGREKLLGLYDTAIERDYRFLSYGDAMLLIGEGS